MNPTTSKIDSPNWLVVDGQIDPSAPQTALQLDSGRVVLIPTALLLEQPIVEQNQAAGDALVAESNVVIPVIAEELLITKRLVPRETVRLMKSSEERIERIEVPVAKEHWEISRAQLNTEVAARSGVRYDVKQRFIRFSKNALSLGKHFSLWRRSPFARWSRLRLR